MKIQTTVRKIIKEKYSKRLTSGEVDTAVDFVIFEQWDSLIKLLDKKKIRVLRFIKLLERSLR